MLTMVWSTAVANPLPAMVERPNFLFMSAPITYDDFMDGVATYADYKNAIASENSYNSVFSKKGGKPLVSYSMYQEHGTDLYRPLFEQGVTFIDFMSTLAEAPADFVWEKEKYKISRVDIASGLIVDDYVRDLRSGEKVYGKFDYEGNFLPILISNCWNFVMPIDGYDDYIPVAEMAVEPAMMAEMPAEEPAALAAAPMAEEMPAEEAPARLADPVYYETNNYYYEQSNGYGYEPYWDYGCGCYNYGPSYGYGYQYSMGFSSCWGCGDYGYDNGGYYYDGDTYYYGGDTYIDYGDYEEGDYYSDDDVTHNWYIHWTPPTDSTTTDDGEEDSNNNGGGITDEEDSNNNSGNNGGDIVITEDTEGDSGNSGGKLAEMQSILGATTKEDLLALESGAAQGGLPELTKGDKGANASVEVGGTPAINPTSIKKDVIAEVPAGEVVAAPEGSIKVVKQYSQPEIDNLSGKPIEVETGSVKGNIVKNNAIDPQPVSGEATGGKPGSVGNYQADQSATTSVSVTDTRENTGQLLSGEKSYFSDTRGNTQVSTEQQQQVFVDPRVRGNTQTNIGSNTNVGVTDTRVQQKNTYQGSATTAQTGYVNSRTKGQQQKPNVGANNAQTNGSRPQMNTQSGKNLGGGRPSYNNNSSAQKGQKGSYKPSGNYKPGGSSVQPSGPRTINTKAGVKKGRG